MSQSALQSSELLHPLPQALPHHSTGKIPVARVLVLEEKLQADGKGCECQVRYNQGL